MNEEQNEWHCVARGTEAYHFLNSNYRNTLAITTDKDSD